MIRKIIYIISTIFVSLLIVQGCSIGSSSGYCEYGWFKNVNLSLNKCNYRKTGVCKDSLDILMHREATLKKSYEGLKCEEN
ncbi:hypothetical protein BKH42_03615 [Helicobacter sp. 13S00482-2]|uniref:hypothetical protein n=1 Tax=Helicobacter sp. 13S00482-2 TaxID=1476200 RepID=UPI000BA5A39C|nr:hypothetical protein [Helicobacter sp. 13S00482-2]PAF53829.1 hypothetical protein BKH42_03615 [Helicobacter sp. 13S00482-2]